MNYKWKMDSKLRARILDNRQQGINVTAVKEGESIIELLVSNKDGELLYTAKKNIFIHKTLDIQEPTLIGL